MSDAKSHRPSIAVLGLGDYYAKLRSSLNTHFRPAALIDPQPPEALSLSPQETLLYRRLTPGQDVVPLVADADLVLIAAPNDWHASYALELARAGKRVVVEKPMATTREDLDRLRELQEEQAPVYFSDYYLDVRATPLLLAMGLLDPGDWRTGIVRRSGHHLSLPLDIGKIETVTGHLNQTAAFRPGSWTSRSAAGGVVFDLMIHLLGLLARVLPQEDLQVLETSRSFRRPRDLPGRYVADPPGPDAGEAHALVSGRLSPSAAKVLFEVGKDAATEDRFLRIESANCVLTQRFERNHPLHIESAAGEATITLVGHHYDLTVRAMREWFNHGAAPYGWSWSNWAAHKAIEIRELNRQLA